MFALNFNCVKFLFEIRFSITKYVYGTDGQTLFGQFFSTREKTFPCTVVYGQTLFM